MDAIASQITSLTVVYSIVYSDADQRKHQSSASLAFVREIHRGPVNSPHKWPVTRKTFPFDDAIMIQWIYIRKTLNVKSICCNTTAVSCKPVPTTGNVKTSLHVSVEDMLASDHAWQRSKPGKLYKVGWIFRQRQIECMCMKDETFWETHGDIIKGKHLPYYCPFVWDIHRSPVNYQRPVTLSFVIFFDLRLNERLNRQSRLSML